MTDSLSHPATETQTAANPAPEVQLPPVVAVVTVETADTQSDAVADAPTPLSDTPPVDGQETQQAQEAQETQDSPNTPVAAGQTGAKRGAKPDVFPVLEKIAALYPALFGAEFLPLKRGIFQDLMEAHPGEFEKDSLKAAMALHTRSTRYLTVVASGADRHDLQSKAVEAMAPEHVYHALIEVFRRRQMRSKEDLRPKLIGRIVQALEASGLTPLAYAEQVRNRDEAANAALDEAIAEAQAREAKSEALLRAYNSSGKTVEEFADMYGMDPRAVGRLLARTPTSIAPPMAASAPAPAAGDI